MLSFSFSFFRFSFSCDHLLRSDPFDYIKFASIDFLLLFFFLGWLLRANLPV